MPPRRVPTTPTDTAGTRSAALGDNTRTTRANRSNVSVLNALGAKLDLVPLDQLTDKLFQAVRRRRRLTMSYVNFHSANLLTRNPCFSTALEGFDFVQPDGAAVALALRVLGVTDVRNCVHRQIETWGPVLYLLASENGASVFLLGGGPCVAERAAERLMTKYPGLRIVGTCDGHRDPSEDDAVVSAINSSSAVVLLVGMGQPKQEVWIQKHQQRLKPTVIVAVGGYLDKVSSHANAYPSFVFRWRLFWLHRLLKEPRRLWKRYTAGLASFVWRVLRARVAASNRSS